MPPIGWVRSVDESAREVRRPILFGEELTTKRQFVLASRSAAGDRLHFRVRESCFDVLHERYHQGLVPSIEMRLPFNYSTLPHWLLNIGRRLRAKALTSRCDIPFPDFPDAMPIVDWYRQLAEWSGLKAIPSMRWPAHHRAAVVVTHDVDSGWILSNRKWIKRICRDEREFGIRGAWYTVPMKSRTQQAENGLRWLRDQGCELGCHGFNHDAKLPLKLGTNEFHRRWSAICRFCDQWRIRGFRSEWLFRSSVFLAQLAKRFDYDTSVPSASQHLTAKTGNGCGSAVPYRADGGILELPISLPLDTDCRGQGLDLKGFWQRQVDRAQRIAQQGGLIVVTIHPQPHLSARSEVWPTIAQALEQITNIRGLWITRPIELAQWFFQCES